MQEYRSILQNVSPFMQMWQSADSEMIILFFFFSLSTSRLTPHSVQKVSLHFGGETGLFWCFCVSIIRRLEIINLPPASLDSNKSVKLNVELFFNHFFPQRSHSTVSEISQQAKLYNCFTLCSLTLWCILIFFTWVLTLISTGYRPNIFHCSLFKCGFQFNTQQVNASRERHEYRRPIRYSHRDVTNAYQ